MGSVKGEEMRESVRGNGMDGVEGKVRGVEVGSGGGGGRGGKVLIGGVRRVKGSKGVYVVEGMGVGDNMKLVKSKEIE